MLFFKRADIFRSLFFMIKLLGNREAYSSKILEKIIGFVGIDKIPYPAKWTFIDIMAGTGSVARKVKMAGFKIIANDTCYQNYIYNSGLFEMGTKCGLKNLAEYLSPGNKKNKDFYHRDELVTDYLNKLTPFNGFITQNYTKGKAKYFDTDYAQMIDSCRIIIEKWFIENHINEYEKNYLIAGLLEVASNNAHIRSNWMCANYGMDFHYDFRYHSLYTTAKLHDTQKRGGDVTRHCVSNFDATKIYDTKYDNTILFIDPPYQLSRNYCTYYDVPITIAKYDSPELKGDRKRRADKGGFPSSIFNHKKTYVDGLKQILNHTRAKYVVGCFMRNDDSYSFSDLNPLMEAMAGYAKKRFARYEIPIQNAVTDKPYAPWRRTTRNKYPLNLFCIER